MTVHRHFGGSTRRHAGTVATRRHRTSPNHAERQRLPTMDTQTQRKLEQLFELLSLPPRRIAWRMRVPLAPCWLMTDVDAYGITLTLALPQPDGHAVRCLPLLLQACAPEWTPGIPVRACVAQGGAMLVATPPARLQALAWFGCLSRMRRLLERVDARRHRAGHA
ncbi:hypothetical protein A6P55_15850 [Pandoraea pnomenusa]|nr:hypothetical protein A6P55_15850 [Pandoraea pnomenusa]